MELLLGAAPFGFPVYQDLADRIRMLVVDGRLAHDVRLPSERDLCEILGLSRTTVSGAYAELRERGYLEARRGAGNFVTLPYTQESSALLPTAADENSEMIGLTTAASTAPDGVAAAYHRAMERLPAMLAGTGYLPDGAVELRELVAASFTQRGLDTDPDQIVITAGALSALNIVARCLLSTGDRVLLETPTYVNAIGALRANGARMTGFPVTDDDGDAEGFESALRQTRPRLAYLIPDFHNPTGVCQDDAARAAAASAMRRTKTIGVIDETLVDLPLDGQSMPMPFAVYAPNAITIGSASKSFWGGLRTGWIRAPRRLIAPLIETRAALDLSAAPLEQAVTADLLADPVELWTRQRARLARQRDHLLAELGSALPDWTPTHPRGGLSLWLTLPVECSTRLASVAERHGLMLSPGPAWQVETGGDRHLRFPFAAREDVLSEAVRRLTRAYHETRSLSGVTTPSKMRLSA